MLFRRLMEYGRRLESGYVYYQEDDISLVVDICSDTGSVHAIAMGDQKPRLSVPKAVRTSATRPFLLVEGPEYVLGLPVGTDDTAAKRAKNRTAAYWDLLRRCAEETGSSGVLAVARLESDPEGLSAIRERLSVGQVQCDDGEQRPILTAGQSKQWVAFRVDGSYVHEEQDVAAFWAAEVEHESGDKEGRCSVCGQIGPLARKSPVKAKGVGAAALTSADKPAFQSFGLNGYPTTSVCLECAYRVTIAFNDLMDWSAGGSERGSAAVHNRGGSHGIGSAKTAYWSTGDPEFATNVMRSLEDPSSADVAEMFRSPHSGVGTPHLQGAAFHSFTASGNSGRVVFRDWIDVPLRQVRDNLETWFARVRIVDWNGVQKSRVGISKMMASTVRRPKEIRSAEGLALLRTAVLGSPFPRRLQAAAIRRAEVERRMTHARASLLKASVLYRGDCAGTRTNKQEDHYVKTEPDRNLTRLNPSHPSPAYHLGRLLAVLDEIQYQAQQHATVVDRNIGAATNSPMVVFPRLLEMARKAHLPKIERAERKGHRNILQRRLESLIPSGFPRRLGVEDKSLFMVGLYHEEAHRRAKIAAARAEKQPDGGEVTEVGA